MIPTQRVGEPCVIAWKGISPEAEEKALKIRNTFKNVLPQKLIDLANVVWPAVIEIFCTSVTGGTTVHPRLQACETRV